MSRRAPSATSPRAGARRHRGLSARQLATLQAVSAEVAAALNPADVAELIVHELNARFGYELPSVYILGADGLLHLAAQLGYERPVDHFSLSSGVVGRVSRTRQSALITRPAEDPDFIHATHGVASAVCVPIVGGDRLFGVISVESRRADVFTMGDVTLLDLLARMVAVALRNAELYRAMQDEAARRQRSEAAQARAEADRRAVLLYEQLLERLERLAQALGAARDLTSAVRALREFVLVSTPGNSLFVSLYHPETQVRECVYAWSDSGEEDVSQLPPMPMNDSPHARAVTTGRVIVVDDFQAAVAGAPRVDLGLDADPRLPQSSVAVPMAIMGRVIGGFEVQSVLPAAFGPEHIVALTMAATLAAMTLENLRLLEEHSELERLRAEEAVTRAKYELVGVVSHELRTPLTSLVGFAEMLLMMEFPPEKQRQFLRIILDEGQRLTSLLNDFLDLRRMESGQYGQTLVEQDLAVLLRRAVEAAGDGPLHPLVLQLEPLPPVLADADRVQQVLANLLSNARKYSPQGGDITLSARAVAGGVEVAVADRGLGIPSEHLPHLFEKFYRVDNSDHRSIKGTGLGLAICRHIVEAHGGRIWAESPGQGQGTTVRFTLPQAPTCPPGTGRATPTRAAPQ